MSRGWWCGGGGREWARGSGGIRKERRKKSLYYTIF